MSKSQNNEKFTPPRFAFIWLATTFILPLLILIIPDLLTKDNLPFMTKAVIALSVLSVLLFISCLTLIFYYYDISFRIQVMELKLDKDTELLKIMKAQNEKIHTLEKQLNELQTAKSSYKSI